MFRGVVNPPLRNMDGAFAKIADGLLNVVAKILTIFWKNPYIGCFVGFNLRVYVFNSYLRPYQLDQYANLGKVNFQINN